MRNRHKVGCNTSGVQHQWGGCSLQLCWGLGVSTGLLQNRVTGPVQEESLSKWSRSGTCSHLQGKGAARLSIARSLLLLLPNKSSPSHRH